MITEKLIAPVSRLMSAGAVARDWTGLAEAIRFTQRPVRKATSIPEISTENQGIFAKTIVETDWVFAGAELLKAENRPGTFSSNEAIGEGLRQAESRGQLIERFSLYSHQLAAQEAGHPMSPELEEAYQHHTDRMLHYWQEALQEVRGDRSRLPAAQQLIDAVQKVNGVLPARVRGIIEATVDPVDIRISSDHQVSQNLLKYARRALASIQTRLLKY